MPNAQALQATIASWSPPPSRRLSEIADVFLGAPVLRVPDDEAEPHPAIGVGDLAASGRDPAHAGLRAQHFRPSRAAKAVVRAGDLLVAARGTLTHAVLVGDGSPLVGAVATENVMVVRMRPSAGVRPAVLALLLDHGGELRQRVTSSGALFHISPNELRTWVVPLLPEPAQEALEAALLALRAGIAAAERANAERNALLHAIAASVRDTTDRGEYLTVGEDPEHGDEP